MFSDRCEMAYGEQAALVGLCNLVRPKLAIEIGTYVGGSLDLLAPRCGHVHTFDLVSHTRDRLPNVTYHVGDSRTVLPGVLEQLDHVDLALVDGDHSRAGVRGDIERLLASAAVRQTLIVCHDAANEGVRAGIRDALRASDVAYANLSFVPPAERPPLFREAWGGLGLIVIDKENEFWPHRRRVDSNVEWPTALEPTRAWRIAGAVRRTQRAVMYGARPVVRRMRGVRGVKLGG